MLPEIQGARLEKPTWSAFTFDRVLQYYDGPRLLLQKSQTGQLFLAWWCDSDESTDRWIYLPVSESRLQTILSGEMPDLEALQNSEDGYVLVVDIDLDSASIVQTVMTDADALPSDVLPSPDVRLSISMPEEISSLPSRERSHMLSIRIQGDPLDQTGRVGAKIVGQVIGHVQRLLDAIGQAKAGNPTTRGSIPDSILEQTRLDPVSTYVGSFGIRLETNQDDDMLGASLVRNSLEGLFDLLDVGYESSGLTSQLTDLKARVAKNYGDFLSTIETSLDAASLTWSQPGKAQSRQVRITHESARNIIAQIESVSNQVHDNLILQGIFIGGNTRTMRFEIQASDTEESFVGSIDPEAFSDVDHFPLHAPCQAILQPHLEINEATGEEKTTYCLLKIQRMYDSSYEV